MILQIPENIILCQFQKAQQGEGESVNEVKGYSHPHHLSAQGAWDSDVRAKPGSGEAGHQAGGGGGVGRPAERGCSQLEEATTRVRVHVPTCSLSSVGSGVWPGCTSWRGWEGGARQGAWHRPPAFCTYVSLANVSPFEDSFLMQPQAGEGTTHSVCL